MTAKIRFHIVLIFAIAVGYFYIAVAYMEKYNTVQRKNQKLEEAFTVKEQEKSIHPNVFCLFCFFNMAKERDDIVSFFV